LNVYVVFEPSPNTTLYVAGLETVNDTFAFPVTPDVVVIVMVEVLTKLIPFAVTVESELDETGKLATPAAP
jgi:hypothetical protein